MGPAVGIDIGGTKLLAVRLEEGRPVAEHRVPTPRHAGEVLDAIREAVAGLVGDEDPGALGVGMPGLVDRAGVLRFSAHLPGLVGAPVADELREALPGTAVWAGNDATAAAWAESTVGAGVGAPDVVMVTLGTGIGGGMVSGGRLVEGRDGLAGEWGHMMVDPHGPPCPCGQRGCWERFASGAALGRLGREAGAAGRAPGVVALAGGDPEAVRGEHVTRAAAGGDPGGLAVMRELAWWLGLGLANLANILDPAVIVIGGGLIGAGDVLLDPVRDALATLVEGGAHRPAIPVRPAALGTAAGAVGAGLLASTTVR